MSSSSHGDEARRALADELEAFTHVAITRMEKGDKTAAHLATEDMCVVMIKSIPLIIAALRAEPVRAVEEMETFGFVDCLRTADLGFARWAAKPHNARWARKVDGTPIRNDLCVNIAEQFAEAIRSLPIQPAAEGGAE